jgi:hypothetical protein
MVRNVGNRLNNGKRAARLSTFLKISDALEIGFEGLENRFYTVSMVREIEFPAARKNSASKGRIAKLNLSKFYRIEIRKTAQDKQPIILSKSYVLARRSSTEAQVCKRISRSKRSSRPMTFSRLGRPEKSGMKSLAMMFSSLTERLSLNLDVMLPFLPLL